MTPKEVETLTKFFKEMVRKSDAMIIMSLSDGQMYYCSAASAMESAYMTDVVKCDNLLQNQNKGDMQ